MLIYSIIFILVYVIHVSVTFRGHFRVVLSRRIYYKDNQTNVKSYNIKFQIMMHNIKFQIMMHNIC